MLFVDLHLTAQDPVDKLKITKAKKVATLSGCIMKNKQQHKERQKLLPGPHKPVSSHVKHLDKRQRAEIILPSKWSFCIQC